MHHSEEYISVLNGALWNMEQVHCGISELVQSQQLGNPASIHVLLFE